MSQSKVSEPKVLTGEPNESLGPVKMVKITQSESGPFSVTNNLCSIEFDGENVTDLSRSYLDLSLKVTLPNGEVVPDCRLGDFTTEASYMGSAFIKTATLRSEKVGVVEQFRYQNVHSETMKQFLKYTQEQESGDILNQGNLKLDEDGQCHVIVPLKDILGCAKASVPYPNNRMGPSTLQLELENNKSLAYTKADDLMVQYNYQCANIAQQEEAFEVDTITFSLKFGSITDAEMIFMAGDKKATLNYNDGEEETIEVTITDVATDPLTGETNFTFIPPIQVPQVQGVTEISLVKVIGGSLAGADILGLNDEPKPVSLITFANSEPDYWTIGSQVWVSWFQQTHAGIQPNDRIFTAFGIVADVNVNQAVPTSVDVLFESPIFNIGAGFDAVSIRSFIDIIPQPLKWEISQVDLILVKPIKPFLVPKYEFQCQNLEMVNLPEGVPFFKRQFELETTCDRVLLLNPVSCLVGVKQFESYRNSLNNVQTTTEDVTIDETNNASLYYDRWLLAVDDIKRLQSKNGSLEAVGIVEAVVPQVEGLPNNVMQFELNSPVSGGVQSSMLHCYKRITKIF